MKIPEIKSWDCVEHDPIENWQPDDPAFVDFWCNVSIGIKGENGADNFQIHIVTQSALSQIMDHKHLIVIPYYESWNQVLDIINFKISKVSGINWQGISSELSRMFHHEYTKTV